MNVMGSVYAFRGTLINITYGELLEVKSRVKSTYFEFLFLIFIVTDIAIFLIFFEPNVLEFLRPTDIYLIGELFVPVVLWSTMNVALTVSQYISTIMQGVDRVDMESEIRLSTYCNSLVFFANIAEFISTVSYVALIVPMIFLAKFIHIQLYVIDGVIISSWISIILAIIIRAKKYPEIKEYIPVKSLLKDYAAPLLVVSAVLYVLKYPLMIVFAPTFSDHGTGAPCCAACDHHAGLCRFKCGNFRKGQAAHKNCACQIPEVVQNVIRSLNAHCSTHS